MKLLQSMRARMTLGFVLVLAPFLIVSSHLVLLAGGNAHSEGAKVGVFYAQKKALMSLSKKQWREDLSQLFDSREMREKQIGALVADMHDHVLWRSAEYAPSWPTVPGATLEAIHGPFKIHIAIPDAMFEHQRKLHALLLLSGAAVLAFGLGSWLLVGRTLSPIRELANQAATASVDDLGTRLTSPSGDVEMQELVSTLNGFLGRMEEASHQKASFYGAASHELRTPLQALSGHLEVALAQPRDNEEYQATLREAHVQTQRLVSLVEGILLLHRIQGVGAEQRASACPVEAVEEAIESLRPLIEARGLVLDTHLERGLAVKSVPMHLNVLVRNLLENAARYGREGGTLEVRLDKTRLTIENDAPDGSRLDPEKLFEPFQRTGKAGGNGLGLAICQAVAKANGWSLSLRQEGDRIVAKVDFA